MVDETEMQLIDNHMKLERNATLSLYGLTENELTPEQDSALMHYVRVEAKHYVDKYGAAGPKGAALDYEHQDVSEARFAWEESIKPAHIKVWERVKKAALAHWLDINGNDAHAHVVFVDEAEQKHTDFVERFSDVTNETRLFLAELHIGSMRDSIDVRMWFALQTDKTLELLECSCTGLAFDGEYYQLDELTPEISEELMQWTSLHPAR